MNPQWFLTQISQKADVSEYLISQERHEDGGYHIHAYFKFTKKLDRRDPEFFDVLYYKRRYHPNIQRVKGRYKLFRYIKKDKQFITNLDETRPKWLQLVQDCDTEQAFLEELMWTIGRIDNYAGYRTLRDLFSIKLNSQMDSELNKKAGERIDIHTYKERKIN